MALHDKFRMTQAANQGTPSQKFIFARFRLHGTNA
jgi:hypothetical protein